MPFPNLRQSFSIFIPGFLLLSQKLGPGFRGAPLSNPPATPEQPLGNLGLDHKEYGIWVMGYEIWDMGYGL